MQSWGGVCEHISYDFNPESGLIWGISCAEAETHQLCFIADNEVSLRLRVNLSI